MAEILEFVIQGTDEFGGVFDKLLRQLPLIGTAAAVTGAALLAASGAIAKLTTQAADAGEHIYNMSHRLGISAKFIQEVGIAADQADVPIDMMEKALGRMALTVSEASYKVGPAQDAYRELGVELFNQAGKLKTAEQIYPDIADGIAKIGSASRQAELAGVLFGVRSIEMLQVLKNGSEAFEEARRAAEKYGTVMDDHMIATTVRFNDIMKETTMALTGVRNEIAERVMPIIAGLVSQINDWLADNRGTIAAWSEKIIRSLFYIYEVTRRIFVGVGRAIGNVFAALSDIQVFKMFVTNAWEAFKSVIMIAYEAVNGIGNAINIIIGGSFMGLVNVASWVWDKVKEIFGGKEIADSFGDVLEKSGDDIAVAMKQLWAEMPGKIAPHLKSLKTQIQEFLGTDLFTSVGGSVDKMIEELKRLGAASAETAEQIEDTQISTFEKVRAIWNDWFGTWTTLQQDMQAASKQTWQLFQQGIGDAIGQAVVYGKNLHDMFSALWKQIAASAISALVQIGIKQLMQAMITKAIVTADATTKLAAYSAETYAGVYASNASIPYIGTTMAAAMAAGAVASMIAGAEASAAMGAAAGGSIGGVAHGGLTEVQREETFLLDKGERVVSPEQNKDLKEFMSRGSGGGGQTVIIQQLHINSPMVRANWDQVMEKDFIPAYNRAIKRNVFVEGR